MSRQIIVSRRHVTTVLAVVAGGAAALGALLPGSTTATTATAATAATTATTATTAGGAAGGVSVTVAPVPGSPVQAMTMPTADTSWPVPAPPRSVVLAAGPRGR